MKPGLREPNYRTVFRCLPLPAALVDTEGTVLSLNATARELIRRMGYPVAEEDWKGRSLASLGKSEDGSPCLMAIVARALRDGHAVEPRWAVDDVTGRRTWLELHANAVGRDGESPSGVVIIATDAGERVRREHLRDSQERLRDALWRMAGPDLTELLRLLQQELVGLLPMTAACSVQLRDSKANRWVSYHLHQDGVHLAKLFPHPDGAVMTCWREQRPVFRPDLATEDRYGEAQDIWDRERGYSASVRSVLDVPFSQGTLAVNSHQPCAYSEEDIRTLQDLAQVLAVGFARQADLERLQLELSLHRLRLETLAMQSETGWGAVVARLEDEVLQWLPACACSVSVLDLEQRQVTRYGAIQADIATAGVTTTPEPELWEALVTTMHGGPPLHRRNRGDRLFPPGPASEVNSVVEVGFAGGTVGAWSTSEEAFTLRDVGILEQFAEVISQGYRHLEDLRALRESEERFRQAQKMEAVGQLAGGVAHDFNNVLTVVTGYAQLGLRERALSASIREAFEQIQGAAQMASQLARKLLAFSRREVIYPRVLDLGQVLSGLNTMLARLLGEGIRIDIEVDPNTAPVLFDPGQMDQVILNLALNARDAMPEGGSLSLGTRTRDLAEPETRGLVTLEPGRYVVLTLADTGTGMSPEVLKRLFEPFFTTKEAGRGTGLGLAMVYGAVQQNGGRIFVDSAPGKGTRIEIHLPASVTAPVKAQDRAETSASRGDPVTVLVVEDEEPVRNVICRQLRQEGFMVLSALSGQEALEVAAKHLGPIQLLLTDVVMPGMDGRQLAVALTATRPDLRTVYMSGYAQMAAKPGQGIPDGETLLHKPFAVDDLVRALRRRLSQGQTAAQP